VYFNFFFIYIFNYVISNINYIGKLTKQLLLSSEQNIYKTFMSLSIKLLYLIDVGIM